MTKNAHREFEVPHEILAEKPWRVEDIDWASLPEEAMTSSCVRLIHPIPYGIIPDTGEVVVQDRGGSHHVQMRMLAGGRMSALFDPLTQREIVELSGRAKARIRATWDIAVPTVAELIRWIEAHYGKRGDAAEWGMATPRLLNRQAQITFCPWWLAYTTGVPPPPPAPTRLLPAQVKVGAIKEGQDHRRICEALRRGGANAFWKQADHEDKASQAELVLAAGQEN